MNINVSKIGGGLFLLAIATLVLVNHFVGFIQLSFWSIVVGAVALAFLIHCLVNLSFSVLPIPLAILYFVLQGPLNLPAIGFWTLAVVAIIATIGLSIILPKKGWKKKFADHKWSDEDDEDYYDYDEEDSEDYYYDEDNGHNDEDSDHDDGATSYSTAKDHKGVYVNVGKNKKKFEEGGEANNPFMSVAFGSESRYLHADSLETAMLRCKLGSLEVYFDQVQLSPNGAEVVVDCSLGNVELYIPRHWKVINNATGSLGNIEMHDKRFIQVDNAPTLTVNGSVSLGNLEIYRLKN